MPMDFNFPDGSKFPLTPSTAFSLINAIVVAGSSRLMLPLLMPATMLAGSASASTFNPTANAVLGLTPGPKPPLAAPAIALSICNRPLQNASSPKASNRKIFFPSAINGAYQNHGRHYCIYVTLLVLWLFYISNKPLPARSRYHRGRHSLPVKKPAARHFKLAATYGFEKNQSFL